MSPNATVLHYLFVVEYDEAKRQVSEDVERYTKQEYQEQFRPDERLVLDAGLQVWRDSRVRPGTGFTYVDMVRATRAYRQQLQDNPA